GEPTVPYSVIETISVSITPPDGQTRGFQRDVPCTTGTGGTVLNVSGLNKTTYDLLVEGKNSAGDVLYRSPPTSSIDLSEFAAHEVELWAATGEISFYVQYADTGLT